MSQDIAVSEIRRRILRYWWIPVLCALIGTAVGLAQRLIRRDVEPAEWKPPDR